MVAEGLDWRQAFKDERELGDGGPDAPDNVSSALEARYEELVKAEAEGEAKAEMLVAIATGTATPILPLADEWLATEPMKPKQKLD